STCKTTMSLPPPGGVAIEKVTPEPRLGNELLLVLIVWFAAMVRSPVPTVSADAGRYAMSIGGGASIGASTVASVGASTVASTAASMSGASVGASKGAS